MRAVTKRPATTKLAGVLAALALCCSPIAAQAAPTAQTQAQPRASATARSGPTQVAARPCEAKIAGLVGPDLRMADVVAVGSPPKLTLRRYEHPIQRFDGADRSRGVRAMGTTASWWDDSPGAGDAVGADAWSALTLQGTSLVAVRWRQDRLPLGHELLDRYGSHQHVEMTPLGRGWGAFTQLIDSGREFREFYAYAPRLKGGSIYRYVRTPTGVKSAGVVSGFGDLKAITIISSRPTKDVLLANTSTGRLLAITVPRTTRMTTSMSRLRTSTWQGFERLVASPCGQGTGLLAIDDETGKGYFYEMGHAAGARTPIRAVPGTVPMGDRRVIAPHIGMNWDDLRGA